MPLTFRVSKLCDWNFLLGEMDSVQIRSIGSTWEISLSTSDPAVLQYGIGLTSTITGSFATKDEVLGSVNKEVKVMMPAVDAVRDLIIEGTDLSEFFKDLKKEIGKDSTGGGNIVEDADNSMQRLSISGVDGVQFATTHSSNPRELETDASSNSVIVSRTAAGFSMKSASHVSPGNLTSVQQPSAGGNYEHSSQLSTNLKSVHSKKSSFETFNITEFLDEFGKNSEKPSNDAFKEEKEASAVDVLGMSNNGVRTIRTHKSEMHQSVSRMLTTSEILSDGSSTSEKPQAICSGQCHPICGNLDTKNMGEADELGELPPSMSTDLKWFDVVKRPGILSHFESPKPGLPPPVLVHVKRAAPPPPVTRPPLLDIGWNKATGSPGPVYRELKSFQSPVRRPNSVDDAPYQSGKLLPRPPRTRPYTFVTSVEMSVEAPKVVPKQEKQEKKSFWPWKKSTKKDEATSEAEELEVVWMKKKK